jgi:hypothetical protein
LVLFHICMWSPSTTYHHLYLLSSPSSLPLVSPQHIHCAYFIILFFITNIWVDIQRSVSMCAVCGCALLLSIQSLWILSLIPLSRTPCFSTAF